MKSPRLARAVALCCLFALGCGGARAPRAATGAAIRSPDAPSWAQSGDTKTSDGSLFVCEGEGADEAHAVDAARALCSAKICELCGVEVKSTVETRETLEKVDVERKVVETCRRVRKSEEQVRYRQAGCGPEGCTAWLQVYFPAEAEARECRAYAEGSFADSAECEALIDRFRNTPDRTAASFRARAELLTQAIVACADIDVRPTPKLTALDEILWQGVISPRVEPRPRRPIDKAQPIAERLRALSDNSRDAWKAEYAERAYRAIDRQPLRESKLFVDRIAIIRDAMLGYASIMAAMEALADDEVSPDGARDQALVRALRGLRPVAGGAQPAQILGWVAEELSRYRDALRQPGIEAYFMETYASGPDSVGQALMKAMRSDGRASEDEWQFVLKQMRGCVRCAAALLDLPEHGSPERRVARLVEVARVAGTDAQVQELSGVDPELLLRAEPALDPSFAGRVFTYAWFARWLQKLPTEGRDASAQTVRDSFSSGGYAWRWEVSPAQHRELAARAWRLLEPKLGAMRCEDVDKELSLLESHGVDTRASEVALCRCVSGPRGMRELTELYQRLVSWGASCVRKEGA